MTTPDPDSILDRRFRASQGFDLIVFDRLPVEEQALLAELRQDPDLFGVLKPREGSGLTVKAVDRETALLLLSLREAGALPFFVREAGDATTAAAIERLVFDGVLEVELEGRFLAGPAAAQALAPPDEAVAQGRLARLSTAALQHGEAAGVDDPLRLAALLYAFNREPVSPEWAARLPDADAVLAFLGAGPGTELRRRLDRAWELGERETARGWIVFTPRKVAAPVRAGSSYKLYVSPAIADLPRAFAAVVATLSSRPAGHFKIGSDAGGLLRPDKLVLYFGSLEDLHSTARDLEGPLAGVAAQGVPFSAPIDAAGLLSWGMDPPRSERLLSWQEPESWRLWVARRLAAALVAARGSGSPDLPGWRFALERLRREGVDVDRWTPSAALWAA